MDKKLLDALNNLSVALEDIAEILSKKQSTSGTGAALESGDFSKNLKEIDAGIKSIKADTQEILKSQKTILEMSKKTSSEAKKTPMEEVGGDKKQESNLKKGVGTIILIAVAVLAIGLAFKLVGKIDFLSVIGLGIAIVVIAVAFEKVAKLNLTLKQAAIASLAMVMMSVAVMLSSWALGMIKPISFTQAITGILISGLFTVLSFGLPKIVKALDNIKNPIKTGLYLVLILPAIGLGIAMASWALSTIIPIGFTQAITGILIAGMFSVIAFGLSKIVKAIDKIENPDEMAILIPLMLPAMSLAIAASSWILSLVKPIEFGQAMTAILIAALFTVLSFGIEKITKALGKMKWSDVAKMPVFFTLISAAIAASAFIFAKAAPYFAEITFMMMLKVIILGVAMSVVLVIVAFAMKIMGTLKWGDVIKVPALFTLLSLAIAASAFIIFKASNYINGITFMTMFKLLIFSVVLAIAVAVIAIAMKVVNILGSVGDYIKGGLSVIVIATALMVSSHILAMGNYKKYPDWKWALGVGLSLLAFVPAVAVLGAIAISGVGALALLAGAVAVLGVAATISAASHILATGKYSGGPPVWWAMSTAIALTAFTAGMVLLGGMIVASFGLGAVALAAGGEAVLMVADTIVKTSFKLQKGKYTGGPTKEWAEGIAISLGAFMPVYGMLMNNSILSLFGGGGVGPKEFSEAILTVSDGIITAAGKFAKSKAVFIKGPSAEWAEGVGNAIGAFAPVYQVLAENSGWMASGVSVKDMANAIMTISQGIVDAATFFNSPANTGVFDVTKVPSAEWAEGVGGALGAFTPIFNALSKDTGWFTSGTEVIDNMLYGITSISRAIVKSAIIFGKGSKYFNISIDPNFIKKMSKNVIDYMTLVDTLSKYKTSSIRSLVGLDPVENIANGMVKIAGAYDKLARAIKNFSTALNGMDAVKVNSFTRLTGNLALLSAMDSTMFSNMLRVIESRSGVFANLLKTQSGELVKRSGVAVKGAGGPVSSNPKKDEQSLDAKGETQLQKLDKIYRELAKITGYSKSIDEALQKPGTKKNEDIGAKGDE